MSEERSPFKAGCLSVSVTDQALRMIERIVWAEGYVDFADYVRNLIRKDFRERGIKFEVELPEESDNGEVLKGMKPK